MKTSLSLICSVSFFIASVLTGVAHAQNGFSFGDSGQSFSGDLYGGQSGYGGPMGGAAGPAGGPVGRQNGSPGGGIPGRLWLKGTFADRGLGYTGHYFTLGLKNRLFEDRFDGRWLFEGRVHHSLEDGGGLFTNIGLERIFSIDAAQADVSMSVWYDYDGDARGNFAHDFNQIGASAQIKTPKWDLIGNGYFPIGTANHAFGDPTGVNCFAGNRIVLIPGIDSALQGFDTVLRFRPAPLAMVNGTIDLGGYHYRSDLVDSFAGGKARLGFQALRGAMVSAEVNHDDRFETTGALSVGWLFGANASGRGQEYTPLGRDLESTTRNDHIVRYNREAVVLMNPLTGTPYNVVHVNNQANAAVANGSAERPFSTLLNGQNASSPFDVIAVGLGDGTDANMDQGIVLKDGQRLWGVGVPFFVPNADGTLFQLCGTSTTQRPTISNSGGTAVVTLANNNDVAGIDIDATGAQFGVLGSGNNGSIRDNRIRGATSHGAQIANASGDWRFDRNTFESNGGSGLAIQNHFDNTAALEITNNTARNNLLDGIMLQNVSPESLVIRGNTTSENVRHGLHVNNFFATNNQPIVIDRHTSLGNLNRGIMIDRGVGSIQLFNSTLSDNTGAGFTLQNWNNLAGQGVVIGSAASPNTFLNNGAMGNIELLLTQSGLINNVVVTGNRSDNGIRGLYARVEGFGVPTTLNIDILDNASFSNNRNDGIAMDAINSGIINTRIASTVVGNRQPILGNGSAGGAGIMLRANGVSGIPPATINAAIDNVFVNNSLNRIIVDPGPPEVALVAPTNGIEITGLGNSLSNIGITNSQIGAPVTVPLRDTQGGISINLDNEGSNLVNRVRMDNLTMFSDVGLFVSTAEQTFADILMQNSVLRPNGAQGNPATLRSDNTPFTDQSGTTGVLVQARGLAIEPIAAPNELVNPGFPDTDENVGAFELVSDGTLDNLTRVTLVNNDIQDFNENGIDIRSFGDAQLLTNIVGNTVSNNGAGFDNDPDNDNVFDEPNVGPVAVDQLDFFDGIRLRAYDSSTLSANIFQNTIQDNFERGIAINTFNRAIANVSLKSNVLFGNDRGEDADNTVPQVFPTDPEPTLADAGIFDLEAINNAEFYIRPHQSRVVLDADGAVVEAPPGSGFPIFHQGNIGSGTPLNPADPLFPVASNGIAIGAAQLHLGMSSNSLQLTLPDFRNFARAPGVFNVGLDGATNGFTAPFLSNFALPPITTNPITPVTLSFVDNLITNESNFFTSQGF